MQQVAGCNPNIPIYPPVQGALDGISATRDFDFALLRDLISDVVFVLQVMPEETYRFLYVNARFEAATGLVASQVVGRLVDEIIPEASLPLVKQKYAQALSTGRPVQWDEVSVYPTGTKVGEVTLMPVNCKDPDRMLLIGTVHDVTERHEAQARLTELEERWRLALDAAGAAAWDWNQSSNVISFSPQWQELLGREATPLLANAATLHLLVHPADIPLVRQKRHAVTHKEIDRFVFELRLRHANGHWVWVSCNGRAFDRGQAGVRVLGTLTDISATKRSEELLWHQANYDILTGLPNRHLFLDRLQQAIRSTHRNAPAFSLLYIDLDHFKEINDTLGHNVGDRLLQGAAQRLLACARETDIVCRLGGDEFTVLLTALHNTEPEDARVIERIAQAIIEAIAQPFHVNGETLHVSASIGITHFPVDAHDLDSLLKHADQAMYEAKRMGRNRYAYFSHEMQERAQVRRHLVDDLRSAIRSGDLEVHYQPIVDLRTGKICKAEALLRWLHDGRGWISPAEFIPICEETGLIIEIGEWTFQTVVRDAARWLNQGSLNLKVGLNMSPVQILRGKDSCARCLSFLDEMHLPRGSIVIEVTETSLLQNDSLVKNQLRQLDEHGIALALDDFGTGYSALSYLQQYAFQFLKIDQSFVKHMAPGTTKLALCETIIRMAQKLGMRVIAEGIETEQEATLLREAGCDYGQGYHFFHPVPAACFETLLAHDAG